jgi:hypothetical protein
VFADCAAARLVDPIGQLVDLSQHALHFLVAAVPFTIRLKPATLIQMQKYTANFKWLKAFV